MPEGNPFKPDAAGSTVPQANFPFVAECGSCGRRIGVTAGMAGTQVPCQCGQTIAVPLLSDLRRDIGRGAYGDSPLAVVKRLLAGKDSLPGEMCAACRRPTTERIVCLAECESPQAERLPVTLCDECRSATKNLDRRAALNRILRSVPAYARLLDEYPRTKLTLVEEKAT